MLIPSVFVILPKTLLKWTTTTPPHCKSATKFKAKYVKRQRQAVEILAKTTTTTTTETTTISSSIKIAKTEEASTTTTVTAFNKTKQNSFQLIVKFLVSIVLLSLSLSYCCRRVSIESLLIANNTFENALPLYVAVTASVVVSLYALVLILLLNAQFTQNIQNFLSDAVITKLVVLMNDFRMKTLFKSTTTTTTKITEKTIALIAEATKNLIKIIITVLVCNKTAKNFNTNYNNNNKHDHKNNNNKNKQLKSTIFKQTILQQIPYIIESFIAPILPSINNSKNNITVAALVTLRLFNNQSFSSNNHRTYNNSSKSNKVFLHYAPRDPRLRIFESYQEILFNKHHFDSLSELKITEDLCAYGELIGGLFLITTNSKTLQQQVVSVKYPYCDYNKIIKRNNTSQSVTESKSVGSVENVEIVSDLLLSSNIFPQNSHKLKLNELQKYTVGKVEKQQVSLVEFFRNLQFLESEHLKATIKTVGILV
ncbi:DEP domain-containing protein DDB_G0279099 [Eurosta solidaginis]|uniref:DEP domain-containing protein DDB_G0279099 n=1 Tax=Eurosta solidaginis TaxID=178769 RepID=UPI003531170A